jgi:hypothetical protein
MLLSLTLALAPAPVEEKIPLPSGPPPQFVLAVFKDGKCQVTSPVLVPITQEETRTVVRTVNGKPVQVLEKYLVTAFKVQHVTRILARPLAYDRSGKEIDAKRLAQLLAKPTVVLQSVDGKPVDPFYLRTVKEGTLILSMPIAPGEPAPPRHGDKR